MSDKDKNTLWFEGHAPVDLPMPAMEPSLHEETAGNIYVSICDKDDDTDSDKTFESLKSLNICAP